VSGTEVRNEIFSKKILTEAKGYLDIGFTHSLNPYSGCAFACKYCYVREMPIQKFRPLPWGAWLDVKTNAAENYRKEIVSLRRRNDRIWIDTLLIGDGSMGKRSARLGMPQLFEQHGVSNWYREDLHMKVKNDFKSFFPSDRIRVSKEEAFPI
jgi:hypothetical protein